MRSPSRRQTGVALTGALALAMALPTVAQASGDTARHVVGSAPSWTTHARRVAAVPSSATQHLTFVLALRDPAGAQALADAVSTPGTAQYGHFVSAAAWRARLAPTSDQVATVSKWLRSQGLTIGAVPANHRYIEVTAPAAATQKALSTKLSTFTKDGKTVTAPSTAYSVPASLAGLVVGVSGLDTSAHKTPSGRCRTPRPSRRWPPREGDRAVPSELRAATAGRGVPQRSTLLDVLRAEDGDEPAQGRGEPAALRTLRVHAGAGARRLRHRCSPVTGATTAVAPPSPWSTPTRRRHPRRRHELRPAQRPEAPVAQYADQNLPTTFSHYRRIGGAIWSRKPSTSRRSTPWRPARTSSTWARAATTTTSTPRSTPWWTTSSPR